MLTLKAPYKGSSFFPNTYLTINGCGSYKSSAERWNSTSGVYHAGLTASSRSCKTIGAYGNNAVGVAFFSDVLIPIRGSLSGNHTVTSRVAVSLAWLESLTVSACPQQAVSYPPASGTSYYAGCSASTDAIVSLGVFVVDMTNSSWYSSNYSLVRAENSSSWQNNSYCYNYGTPTCYNTTGIFGGISVFGLSATGYSSLTSSRSALLTMWSNATGMTPTDRYSLDFSFYVVASSGADGSNLKALWHASAKGGVDLVSGTNGVSINSIQVL